MMPISACGKWSPQKFGAERQNGDYTSGQVGRVGPGCEPGPHQNYLAATATAPNTSLSRLSRRRLIKALGDHHGVALHIDDNRPILGQPSSLAHKVVQRVRWNRRFLPRFQHVVNMKISFA